MGDARVVSRHLLIGGVNQARAANVVLRLIRAGSCGEAGARTPIMCQNSMVPKYWLLVGHHYKVWSMMSRATEWAVSVSTES